MLNGRAQEKQRRKVWHESKLGKISDQQVSCRKGGQGIPQIVVQKRYSTSSDGRPLEVGGAGGAGASIPTELL